MAEITPKIDKAVPTTPVSTAEKQGSLPSFEEITGSGRADQFLAIAAREFSAADRRIEMFLTVGDNDRDVPVQHWQVIDNAALQAFGFERNYSVHRVMLPRESGDGRATIGYIASMKSAPYKVVPVATIEQKTGGLARVVRR